MVVYSKIAMDNQEEILDALNNFEKKKGEIPPVLEQYLKNIAKTGETLFPWPRVKPLFVGKLEDVMSKFHRELPADHLSPCPNVENPKFKEMRKRILDSVNKFSGAPFTIQRLCELLTDPKKHYRRTDKFLRGIEKNILVVSTVDPFGNKIVSESREVMVNGMEGSPVNGNGAESPTTTTDLTPVQYSGFPQQQTDWTTDSWAGVGTSQESGETTPAGQAEDKGSHQEESSQSPDRSPGEEGDKMEEGEPHQDLRDRESPEGEDASPAKKSKLTEVSSEETPESSSSEVTTQESSKVIQEKADTSSPTENTESSPDNAIAESPEVTTQKSSKVGQEPEAGSSKPESPGDDENSETSVEMEQKDLTENSLESSQVPSPKLEEEKCDKNLPQESVSSPNSRAADDNRDQKSVTAENSENSQEDSSSKIPEEESSPTQSDQSPKESAEESDANLPGESAGESDANLPGEEEHMNVDNGGGSRKCEDDTENPADDPQNGVNDPQNSVNDPQTSADSTQTKETSPSEEEEEEGKKEEEEERGTPMEED